MTANGSPPPRAPPTALPMKRFKFVWRFLLLSNLALGGQNGEIQWRFIEKKQHIDCPRPKLLLKFLLNSPQVQRT
ncbi:hypothetical protein KIW84_040563 [Lathyrus oleraceus]|uniref:Secreted protein n=1 Tax=Pisum sativum TaxID=3888 RepID=A0A9D4X5K2_PEA|nr:hypothetical protein KIW84_040563 [Pisum sativum]